MGEATILNRCRVGLRPTHPQQRYRLWRRCILLVNQQRGQETQGFHGARRLYRGAILRLGRLNGLSVAQAAKSEALQRAYSTSGKTVEAFAAMYGLDPQAVARALAR